MGAGVDWAALKITEMSSIFAIAAGNAAGRSPLIVPLATGLIIAAGGTGSAASPSRFNWIRREPWLTTSSALFAVFGVIVRLRNVSVCNTVVRFPEMATSLTNRLKVDVLEFPLCSTSSRKKFPQLPGLSALAPRMRRPALKLNTAVAAASLIVPFAAAVDSVAGAAGGVGCPMRTTQASVPPLRKNCCTA